MTRTFGSLALGLLLCLPAGVASGAAFSIYEQSPAGTALAGALTARPDDASAIFYNPAGLGFLPGLSVLAGGTLLTARGTATAPGGAVYESQRGVFFLPTLYAAARVHDHVSLGLGAFASHGLGIDWQGDAPFPGRFQVLRASLQTFTLNPTVAVRLSPYVSIGAGVDVVRGTVELLRALSFGEDEGRVDLAAGTWAVGGNVGLLVRDGAGRVSAGLSYRSAVHLSLDGGQVGFTPPSGVAGAFPYTRGSAQIELPHTFAFGVAGKPLQLLTLSADLNTSLWSSTKELRLVLSDDAGALSQTSVTPRDWRDGFAARLGAEVDLQQFPRLRPRLRAGCGFDKTPVPASTLDPSLPDGDRYLVSLGGALGYRGLGGVEVSYMAVLAGERAAENPNLALRYQTTAHVLSAALVLQLDNLLGARTGAFAERVLH